MSKFRSACSACAFALVLSASWAQQDPRAPEVPAQARPAPGVAMPEHRSAFEGYRRYTDEKVIPWKEANDRVGRIGGWRTYARETGAEDAGSGAPQPEQTTPATAAPAPAQAAPASPASASPSTPPAASPTPSRPSPAAPSGHGGHH